MFRNLTLAAVAVAGLIGAAVWMNAGPRATAGLADLGVANAQEAADVDTSGIIDMFIGNPDAEVTVIEYASFTCPHCRSFHETTYKQLKTDYIDTGKIKFVMREVYFDRYGLWAGMLARCGGPDRYFGFVDALFANQADWLATRDPAGIADDLRKLGLTAGLTADEINACLSDSDKAQAMVALYQENAEADGIRSTPSFVINGENYSNMSFEQFKGILDEALGS
jgi:protein-disulfide isomerase